MWRPWNFCWDSHLRLYFNWSTSQETCGRIYFTNFITNIVYCVICITWFLLYRLLKKVEILRQWVTPARSYTQTWWEIICWWAFSRCPCKSKTQRYLGSFLCSFWWNFSPVLKCLYGCCLVNSNDVLRFFDVKLVFF